MKNIYEANANLVTCPTTETICDNCGIKTKQFWLVTTGRHATFCVFCAMSRKAALELFYSGKFKWSNHGRV